MSDEKPVSLFARAVVALERGAAALERLADQGVRPSRRKPAPEPEELEVSEVDRARARAVARKLGLVVRDPERQDA